MSEWDMSGIEAFRSGAVAVLEEVAILLPAPESLELRAWIEEDLQKWEPGMALPKAPSHWQ
ncbi:hypothetical protein [Novosphingobium sp. ZW T3_23]|uniref:hypothetical protein n=1 Tax=Novosphingobium sp. ZW T3_23 TaxID=3378084 RepID=UPI0038548642